MDWLVFAITFIGVNLDFFFINIDTIKNATAQYNKGL